MRFIVHGKNIELTPALEQYAMSKLGRLDGRFEAESEMHITLAVHGHKREHIVEATITLHGLLIRVEEKQDDMYSAIDLAADKLERRMCKLKDKMLSRQRKKGADKREPYGDHAAEPEEQPFELIRTKNVQLKPVDVQEAILEMKLLDHDFHLFHNRDTALTELVYKRRDGSFGHITHL